MPNKNNQSPEQLIQLHSQYDFGYANFREGVARWVIMGLAAIMAMVEHETTFKSNTSVSYKAINFSSYTDQNQKAGSDNKLWLVLGLYYIDAWCADL